MKTMFDGKFGTEVDEEDKLLLEQLIASHPVAPAVEAPAAAEEGRDWGTVAMQGLAGLGDAITGAYGTKATNFSGGVNDLISQKEKSAQVKAALLAKKEKEKLDAGVKATEMQDKKEYLAKALGLKGEANKLAAENRDATREQTKAYRDQQTAFQKEKYQTSQEEKAAKREQDLEIKNRLSDPDTETVTAFEDSKRKMEEVLGLLGENSNWTGVVDGRVPDSMITDANQVRFRAEIGKLFDKYRKAITGAGAGPSELAMLLKRLPTETDTFDNFKEKATSFIHDSDEDLKTFLANKKKQGKNVSQFAGGDQGLPEVPGTPPKSSQPPPGGNRRVRQGDVEYEWDGSKYVPVPIMAGR